MIHKLSLVLMPITIIFVVCAEAKMDTWLQFNSTDYELDMGCNVVETGIEMKLLGRVGNKIYYRSVGKLMSWVNNLRLCRCYGLQMGSIQSQTETVSLRKLLKGEYIPNNLWTSGFRYNQNTFIWASSGNEFQYSNWAPREPNNLENENCVQMYTGSLLPGRWNDKICDHISETLCEGYQPTSQ